MKKSVYFFVLTIICIALNSQTLTPSELIRFPRTEASLVGDNLTGKGWSQHGFEVNKDSGFTRMTWMIKNNYNDLKSYFQYYLSDADSLESYTIYQFSDRETFNSYKTDLKKLGYKFQKEKKKRGKKKEKNKYKDKEELFLNEKNSSLISLKEVFLLGFNTFLVSSYHSNSRVAKTILDEDK